MTLSPPFLRPGRVLLAALLAVLLAGCGAGPRGGGTDDDAERSAVLAAVAQFIEAMETRDVERYAEVLVPEATTFSQRIGADDSGPIRVRTNREHIDALARSTQLWEERVWSPIVRVHGPLAHVWTPYDFRVDGEFSHCGIDSFQYLKVDGAWRMAGSSWTVETESCEPGPPPAHDAAAQAEAVLATLHRMLDAMAAQDTAAYARILVPEAMAFILRVEADGVGAPIPYGNAERIARLAASGAVWSETLHDPVVMVHPPIAAVWAPYDFFVDGEFSHCGVNIFEFFRIDGEWRHTSAAWTVETQGCDRLRERG
jgi:hypothetical protein